MEVTLLIEAMDSSFLLMENARNQAVGLLDTAVRLTAETRQVEAGKLRELLQGARQTKTRVHNCVVTFLLLYCFWIVLSGRFDLFHLSAGALCSGIVAVLTHDLLFLNVRIADSFVIVKRFAAYLPWLLWQIVSSNIYVASVVLSPKKEIDPRMLRFTTKLESDISWVTLANSITLTPGTVTLDVRDGEFLVHALDGKVAADLNAGDMEEKVAHVFLEADHMFVQDVLDVAPMFGALKRSV